MHDWHVIFYGTETDPQPGSPIQPNIGNFLKLSTKSKSVANGRKVKFASVNKQQAANSLASICPSCFKKSANVAGKSIPSKPKEETTEEISKVTTNDRDNLNKNPALSNIAQVCPQCFKKKKVTTLAPKNIANKAAPIEIQTEFESFLDNSGDLEEISSTAPIEIQSEFESFLDNSGDLEEISSFAEATVTSSSSGNDIPASSSTSSVLIDQTEKNEE